MNDEEDYLLVAVAMVLAATAVYLSDGRAHAHPNTNVMTIRKDYFRDTYRLAGTRAFCRSFRMTRQSFDDLVDYLERVWHVYSPNELVRNPAKLTYPFAMKVAITLSYLGSKSSMSNIADMYGCSLSAVQRAVRKVTRVLYYERERHIFFPRTATEWDDVASGFQAIAGFPDVCGAVDGTLIKRVRLNDVWGWYSRKGYVSYNVQGIVDVNMHFTSVSVRSSGCNDKTLWSKSLPGMTTRYYCMTCTRCSVNSFSTSCAIESSYSTADTFSVIPPTTFGQR